MKVGKVKRLANPRKSAKKKNAHKRMSDKQIRHFGTKAQRAALKRRKSAARTKPKSTAKRNPKTKVRTRIVYRTRTVKATTKKRRRKSNPLQMVTLGLINPRKGKGMTKTKKRRTQKSTTARRQNKKRNGTRIVVMGRRPNKHRARKGHRNPSIAGVSGAKNVGELLLGGVGGVILASVAPGFLPAAMTGNPVFSAISVGVIGWVAGMGVAKMGNKNVGDGVMFGAWLSATKDLITNFVPGLPGLSGMGMFVPAQFNEPDNPVWAGNQRLIAARAAQAAAAAPSTSLKGVMSAYGNAY
jgi:hypothetical protein